ncbi:MAG: asparaginase [Spirochaetales bacterium]|nr:asparaginase [Spirochaetales bacterium]
MRRILLIGTGGTIASRQTDDGLAPSLSISELLEKVPEIAELCVPECLQLFNMDSTNIRPEHWLEIARTIRENYSRYDGFVITHGTDTMAYTAAGLSYLIQDSPKPIVITGAQISVAQGDSDARRNMIDSFLCASDSRSHGVLIVFSGSVILGTRARKNYTKRFAAFASANYPEVARIQSGHVFWFVTQEPEGDVVFSDSLCPNVGLIKLFPGITEDVITFMTDHYDGLVVECFGVGGLPEYYEFYSHIRRSAQKGTLIVMTTQVPNDGSDLTLYKVGHKLTQEPNVLEARDMTSEAALAKLMWILGRTRDVKEAKRLFYTPVAHDMIMSQ